MKLLLLFIKLNVNKKSERMLNSKGMHWVVNFCWFLAPISNPCCIRAFTAGARNWVINFETPLPSGFQIQFRFPHSDALSHTFYYEREREAISLLVAIVPVGRLQEVRVLWAGCTLRSPASQQHGSRSQLGSWPWFLPSPLPFGWEGLPDILDHSLRGRVKI